MIPDTHQPSASDRGSQRPGHESTLDPSTISANATPSIHQANGKRGEVTSRTGVAARRDVELVIKDVGSKSDKSSKICSVAALPSPMIPTVGPTLQTSMQTLNDDDQNMRFLHENQNLMEAMQETTDDRDSEAARGSGTGLVTQIRTVADDDQNTRSLHEVQNLMEAMQEIPDDGQTKVSQNLDTGLVSHEPTVTGQYATPEPLQHVAQLDDRRLLFSKWIPTSDDENCVFHHGPTDFVVAGNGYRLCPALLLNATLFQVILDTAKANQHIRSSTRMIEQNSAPLRKRREHVALQIGRKEAVRARLWDELDELKAQEGRMFDENDHTELVEKIDKVGEDLEELEREADEVEASIGDCSGPDLAGTRAQLSTLHWQADRIIETALVRIGYLPAADEPTLRTAYPEENDRWLAYELSNSKQELEKIEAELFLYRDNYNSQFKHWAVPYKSSKSLEKLEEDFGAVWVRRGQKLARDLAQAERECTALKEEKPEVTKGLEKLEKSGLVNVDYDRAVDKAGYYELRVDKKRKWVDDWVPEWTPEEGPFPHPPPPSSSRSIASIRTVGSPIPPSVSGPEKKQPSQRSSKQRNDRRTRQIVNVGNLM